MPKISRWFIKTGIIYFLIGILLSIVTELPGIGAGSLLLPVYWHMIVIGWLTQIIMGVSIWMFPRKDRSKKKRESAFSWTSYWLLNSGLLLRFLTEPFLPLFQQSAFLNVALILSSLLQIAGIASYIIEIWPRLQARKNKNSAGSNA